MKKLEEANAFISQLRPSENKVYQYDEKAINGEYERKEKNESSLTIKIVSISGGIIASFAFLGFLAIAGLFESATVIMILGFLSIGFGIWSTRIYDKLIFDTLSITTYIIGLFLVGFGLIGLEIDENTVNIIIPILALFGIIISKNYLITFLSILIIGGSFIVFILSNDFYDLIHIYNIAVASLLSFLFLKESKIIVLFKKYSKLYDPVRIGLVISFIFGLIILGKRALVPYNESFIWITSIPLILILMYMTYRIIIILKIDSAQKSITIYALSILALLSISLAPAILGALLIILLSFYVNFKTSFVIGIIALIYFVSQYYYDLNFTLLTKSIILFSSGIFFIALYYITNFKNKHHEKI